MSKLTDKNKLTECRPDLAAQWHPTKNGDLRPDEISYGSKKDIWWICTEGHSFQAKPNSRSSKNSSCPYCSGRRVGPDNNLAFKYPEIADQWHPKKNGSLNPTDVTAKSSKQAWWVCAKGHSYKSVIANRTGNGTSCPYCSGNKVGDDNNLVAKFPAIAKQWHPTKNANLTPKQVTHGTAKKVWWLCPIGHSYEMKINSRTSMGTSCPYCSGRRVGRDNNLLHLFPDIAKEWHPTKNLELTPRDVTSKSDRSVWWRCPNGHSYKSVVKNRTLNGSKCPKCSNQSSEPELRIVCELKTIFKDVLSRHKIEGVEVDVYLPHFKIAIEYDGKYWHRDKHQLDIEKNAFLEARGVNLIRVREAPLEALSSNDMVLTYQRSMSKAQLNQLMDKMLKFVDTTSVSKIKNYIAEHNFLNEALFKKYLSYFPNPFPERALPSTHPLIAAEWDYQKNYPLTPDNFSFGSGKEFWWICKAGHSYKRSINKRTTGLGCTYCSGRQSLNLDFFD